MLTQDSEVCPRCQMGRLREWSELSDEEREVVERLPASAKYAIEDRASIHLWCTRCWYEETGERLFNA